MRYKVLTAGNVESLCAQMDRYHFEGWRPLGTTELHLDLGQWAQIVWRPADGTA